mmetsp:Transcript_3490/g.7301  ORF Transcript_3490/g.7301 Transcript_3490/m.7301 type:complete len:305 (+) Transcript_3490:140-1054(+)
MPRGHLPGPPPPTTLPLLRRRKKRPTQRVGRNGRLAFQADLRREHFKQQPRQRGDLHRPSPRRRSPRGPHGVTPPHLRRNQRLAARSARLASRTEDERRSRPDEKEQPQRGRVESSPRRPSRETRGNQFRRRRQGRESPNADGIGRGPQRHRIAATTTTIATTAPRRRNPIHPHARLHPRKHPPLLHPKRQHERFVRLPHQNGGKRPDPFSKSEEVRHRGRRARRHWRWRNRRGRSRVLRGGDGSHGGPRGGQRHFSDQGFGTPFQSVPTPSGDHRSASLGSAAVDRWGVFVQRVGGSGGVGEF